MVTFLSLLAVLLIGVAAGLLWRNTIALSDRRALDRLASLLLAEVRMEARTQAAMRAMRQVAREYGRSREDGAP